VQAFPHLFLPRTWYLPILLLAFIGFTGGALSSQAQPFSKRLRVSPPPAGLQISITPWPNSSVVRVRYTSADYGAVRFEIRNERGSVLYADVLRASKFAGDFDLAPLPAGRYTIELQTPVDQKEVTVQIGKPIPVVATLVAKEGKGPLTDDLLP